MPRAIINPSKVKNGGKKSIVLKRKGKQPAPTNLEELRALQAPVPQHPWDRLPMETDLAWGRFQYYRDLDTEERSIKAVAGKYGVTAEVIYDMAKHNKWAERVRLYDAHVDAKAREAFEEQRKKMARRQAQLGQKMQTVAQAKIEQIGSDPKQLEALEPRDAIKMAEVGAKIERAAMGENDDNPLGKPTLLIQWNGPMPKWAPKKFHPEGEVVDMPQLPEKGGNEGGNRE